MQGLTTEQRPSSGYTGIFFFFVPAKNWANPEIPKDRIRESEVSYSLQFFWGMHSVTLALDFQKVP